MPILPKNRWIGACGAPRACRKEQRDDLPNDRQRDRVDDPVATTRNQNRRSEPAARRRPGAQVGGGGVDGPRGRSAPISRTASRYRAAMGRPRPPRLVRPLMQRTMVHTAQNSRTSQPMKMNIVTTPTTAMTRTAPEGRNLEVVVRALERRGAVAIDEGQHQPDQRGGMDDEAQQVEQVNQLRDVGEDAAGDQRLTACPGSDRSCSWSRGPDHETCRP